jgi:hypothetical protein
LQRVILCGGNDAKVLPRGSAKTTWAKIAVIWAALYGHRRFVVLVSGTGELAEMALKDIRAEIETNELLAADFPEVGAPVRKLEGIAARARNMTVRAADGDGAVHIGFEWKTGYITLPAIPGSPACGSRIIARGIEGNIRGLAHRNKGTKQVIRPDLVIIDDPQTRESAGSPHQNATRLATIRGDIIGLAGPRKRVACSVAGTIIRRGDVMDQLTDRQLNPAWSGVRVPMVESWADAHETLWLGDYADLRREGQRAGDEHCAQATAFYVEHRAAMDAGAKVYWEARHEEHELSGIQHAYNLLIDYGEQMFSAEYQNDPKPDVAGGWEVTPEIVTSRLSGVPRGQAPEGSELLALTADVNLYGINWTVQAWSTTGAGSCIDWGKFPPGEKAKIWEPGHRLSEDQAVHAAVVATATEVLGRPYTGADGTALPVLFVGVDSGYLPDVVAGALASLRPRFPGVRFIPLRGFGTKAYRPLKTDKRGDSWHVSAKMKNGHTLILNTDVYRQRMQRAFLLPMGSAGGSMTLYGDKPEQHAVLAEHICCERIVDILHGDRLGDVPVWAKQPGKRNDLGDAMTYGLALASFAGVRLGVDPAEIRRRARDGRKPATEPGDDAGGEEGAAPEPVPGPADAASSRPNRGRPMPRRHRPGGFVQGWR